MPGEALVRVRLLRKNSDQGSMTGGESIGNRVA
jgi:hypothetical protein